MICQIFPIISAFHLFFTFSILSLLCHRTALETIDHLSDNLDFMEFASRIVHPLVRTLDTTPRPQARRHGYAVVGGAAARQEVPDLHPDGEQGADQTPHQPPEVWDAYPQDTQGERYLSRYWLPIRAIRPTCTIARTEGEGDICQSYLPWRHESSAYSLLTTSDMPRANTKNYVKYSNLH